MELKWGGKDRYFHWITIQADGLMNLTVTDGNSYGRTTNIYHNDIIQNQTLAYGHFIKFYWPKQLINEARVWPWSSVGVISNEDINAEDGTSCAANYTQLKKSGLDRLIQIFRKSTTSEFVKIC